MYAITKRIKLNEGAELLLVEYEAQTEQECDCKFSAVRYSDGTTFTLDDWQDTRPETPNEIDEYRWRIEDTPHIGIIMSGLPRSFLYVPVRYDWTDDWVDASV